MTEYIEREALDKKLTAAAVNDENKNCNTWSNAIGVLYTLPAADVAPVVHGKWLRSDDDWDSLTTIRCSICGEEWCFEMIDDVTLLNYKHCPNCGARMDGGADNAKAD